MGVAELSAAIRAAVIAGGATPTWPGMTAHCDGHAQAIIDNVAGSPARQWWYSFVDACVADPTLVPVNTDPYTTGSRFIVVRPVKVTGVRFYANLSSYPKDATVDLWDAAGTSLATATVSVAASGLVEASFASAYTVPAEKVLTNLTVSVYILGNQVICGTPGYRPSAAAQNGPNVVIFGDGGPVDSYPTAGYARPTRDTSSWWKPPIEPILAEI